MAGYIERAHTVRSGAMGPLPVAGEGAGKAALSRAGVYAHSGLALPVMSDSGASCRAIPQLARSPVCRGHRIIS